MHGFGVPPSGPIVQAQPFRVRADVEVTCFKYEGIDAIREALKVCHIF